MLHASILIIRVHIHTLSWKRLVTFWMFRISAHFTGLTRLAMSVQHVKKEKLSHPILHSSLFNGPFTGPLFIFVLFKQFDRIKQTCTKTQKLVQVLWNGPFPDQGPGGGAHGAGSPTQQYNFFAEQTLKISVYFMQRIKSYSIFTVRHTDRQTDAHFASLYARARFFSIWKFIPFTTLRSFVRFAHSLTSFVKDKN